MNLITTVTLTRVRGNVDNSYFKTWWSTGSSIHGSAHRLTIDCCSDTSDSDDPDLLDEEKATIKRRRRRRLKNPYAYDTEEVLSQRVLYFVTFTLSVAGARGGHRRGVTDSETSIHGLFTR